MSDASDHTEPPSPSPPEPRRADRPRPAAPPGATTDWILRHNRLMRQEVVDAILDDRAFARQTAENHRRHQRDERRRRIFRRFRLSITWGGLALVVAIGLYLRLNGLTNVQHWGGDGARDYLVVMRWLKEGAWPLVGPWRSMAGDFAIGPGWYYTLAPLLALTNFHPAAGAATNGLLGIAGIVLSFFWIRRAKGGAAAALIAAALLSFGFGWVETHRICWNPQPLFFAMAAGAFLLQRIPRAPLSSLALLLALAMILPQWHSLGLAVVAAGAIPLGGSLWRARGKLAATRRRVWLLWGLLLAGWCALLYVPPAIWDAHHEKKNIDGYLTRTFFPPQMESAAGEGDAAPAAPERIVAGTRFLLTWMLTRNLNWAEYRGPQWPWWFGGLMLAVILMAGWRWWRRPVPFEPWSPLFLVFLIGGFWLICIARGGELPTYYLEPAFAAPILLLAWLAGGMLRRPADGWRRAWVCWPPALLGLAALALLAGNALWQLPAANAIHNGDVWHGFKMKGTVAIADWIRRDAGGGAISILTADDGNDAVGFHVLLWRSSRRPLNRGYWETELPRNRLGSALYLIGRDKWSHGTLRLEGGLRLVERATTKGDGKIWKIDAASLPGDAGGIAFSSDRDGSITLRPLPANHSFPADPDWI
jgi:hypothetical protein